jgi:alcohol dehydrogenase class IV
MRFEFATAARIIFGRGTIEQVGPLAAEKAKRVFVLTDGSTERAEPLLEQLRKARVAFTTFNVLCEPTTAMVTEGVEQARRAGSDMVVSIGGGSVLDAGKAVSAMLTNSGELEDYLEVIGRGMPLKQRPVPHIAIPTTAGTGAEVTRNAVLASPEHHVKVSMRSPWMLPHLAVVDPELTYSMPPEVTASTGLDALTQLMEAYVSNKANPLTDGICREGLETAAASLRKAYEDGNNSRAREGMALASLFGGLALANAKLGAVHGFAGPLGGMISAPHGAICARLLPHVMQANVQTLQKGPPDSPALARYDEVARILTGKDSARAIDGVEWIQELCSALKVPSLTDFGLKEEDFAAVAAKAEKSSSMKGNPIVLTSDELMDILMKSQ